MMLPEDPDREALLATASPPLRAYVEKLEREKSNAESDAANQRSIAQAAETDYRRAQVERNSAYAVLRRIRALTVGRGEISSKVLRGMIDILGGRL